MSDEVVPFEDHVSDLLAQDDQRQAWERIEGETARAYSAFVRYRNLGPGRTLAQAAKDHNSTLIAFRSLSSEHSWVQRANLYDDALERRERQVIERGRLEARQRQIQIAQNLQEKALAGLLAMNPYTCTAKDLVYMADVGTKLERQARGEVDSKRVEFTGAGGGPIAVAQELAPADRQELLERIQDQITSRLRTGRVIEGVVVDDDGSEEG